jgi:NAD(P)H-hydrate epimerase
MLPTTPPASWPRRDADHLLISAAGMADLEAQLFASGLPVEALMEKAGLALSARLLAAPPAAALVLVGPGHNGGDGLVVARELHLGGVPVRLWSPFERHKPLSEAHLRHARWLGIPVLKEEPDPGDPALWIDALFGIGARRPPGEAIEAVLGERERRRPGGLVAIDGPTGLCADSGRPLGRRAARARHTFCLGLLKRGLVQDEALHWVGQLERVDLGLPQPLLAGLPPETPLALGAGDRLGAPWPGLDPAAAKYQRGRLLVVAGSARFRGATHLALSGASASGCGSLRCAPPAPLADQLWSVHPHVVLEPPLATNGAGGVALAGLGEGGLERLDAVLLGPGLGPMESGAMEPGSAELERWRQLREFAGLLVLDADGLNRLAALGRLGEEPIRWLRGRGGPTWLTPHAGEFARLFPDWAERQALDAAAGAAQASGACVLRKGARSVIAAPDGRLWQLRDATATVARAGLGDVLAGYAAGRGAMAVAAARGSQGWPDAALLAAAALDHAEAGYRASAARGPGGATPLAVAEALGGQAVSA